MIYLCGLNRRFRASFRGAWGFLIEELILSLQGFSLIAFRFGCNHTLFEDVKYLIINWWLHGLVGLLSTLDSIFDL